MSCWWEQRQSPKQNSPCMSTTWYHPTVAITAWPNVSLKWQISRSLFLCEVITIFPHQNLITCLNWPAAWSLSTVSAPFLLELTISYSLSLVCMVVWKMHWTKSLQFDRLCEQVMWPNDSIVEKEMRLGWDVQAWYLYHLSITISTNSTEHLLCPSTVLGAG